ncbi:hypothetical protein DPSP01_013112 [Paraphaeosphaeria sporulosa]
MMQLFRPPGADPLATRADTWPYIHNICGYLALGKNSLYRNYIQLFENGALDEATLSSMIRDSHIFDDNFDAELLHDDLIIMILLNKADNEFQATAAPESASHSMAPFQYYLERCHGVAPVLPSQFQHDKIGTRLNHEIEPSSELSSPPPSPPEATPVKRIRKTVGGWEEKMLTQEAESFLTKGKRSIRGRKSSRGVDYHEQSD